jgi:peptidoglycan/LPS O-acetylase OafA/YrhL
MRLLPSSGQNAAGKASNRLQSVDFLRGVAIAMVLAVHLPHEAPGGWRENPWFFLDFVLDFGYLGVPLFIVISGFCIHRSAARARAETGRSAFDWLDFWKRRFIRLYPPYLAAVVLSILGVVFVYGSPRELELLGWRDLLTHLLLMHNLTADYATSLGNPPFWSLGTEEQLYALYFVLLLMMNRWSVGGAVAVAALVSILWRLGSPMLAAEEMSAWGITLGSWYKWPFSYWLNWALGALAVEMWYRNRGIPAWCRSMPAATALILVGASLSYLSARLLLSTKLDLGWIRDAYAQFPSAWSAMGELAIFVAFFILLNRALQNERQGASFASPVRMFLGWLGRISYSVYLTHMIVIRFLDANGHIGYGNAALPVRFALYATATIFFGWLFHLGIERWFLHGRVPGLSGGSMPLAGGVR